MEKSTGEKPVMVNTVTVEYSEGERGQILVLLWYVTAVVSDGSEHFIFHE